eukprot:gene26646-biopygen17064
MNSRHAEDARNRNRDGIEAADPGHVDCAVIRFETKVVT